MIRFACQRCQAISDVPDSRAGFKTHCPKCSQRLQIPRPPPSKTTLRRHLSLSLWLASLGFLAGAVALLVVMLRPGIEPAKQPGEAKKPAAAPAKDPVLPDKKERHLGLEEALVRKHILDNANVPAAVVFDRWGPHDLEGKVWKEVLAFLGMARNLTLIDRKDPDNQIYLVRLLRPQGLDPTKKLMYVRVRFRATNDVGATGLFDEVYSIQGGRILGSLDNDCGDDWRAKVLSQIRAQYPPPRNP